MKRKYDYFVGRYQPLHKGHIKLIRKILKEGKNVCIAIRDTKKSKKDPYDYEERNAMFIKEFKKEIIECRMKIICIPDVENFCHGRQVGWGIREIKLSKNIEKISATKIRNELSKNI